MYLFYSQVGEEKMDNYVKYLIIYTSVLMVVNGNYIFNQYILLLFYLDY